MSRRTQLQYLLRVLPPASEIPTAVRDLAASVNTAARRGDYAMVYCLCYHLLPLAEAAKLMKEGVDD